MFRKNFQVIAFLAFLFICTGFLFADECALEGIWEGTESGAVLSGNVKHRNKTTQETEYFSGLGIKFIFEKPQGHLFHGKKISENHTEEFVGVMSRDKKTIYFSDDDGYSIGTIIDPDTIEYIYLHSGKDSKAAAISTLKRVKGEK